MAKKYTLELTQDEIVELYKMALEGRLVYFRASSIAKDLLGDDRGLENAAKDTYPTILKLDDLRREALNIE